MGEPVLTMEVLERYETDIEEKEWWQENMPKESKYKPTYKYRRTLIRLNDIGRINAIPDNNDECELLLYSSEKMIILDNFDDVCIRFNDLCNGMMESGDYDISN